MTMNHQTAHNYQVISTPFWPTNVNAFYQVPLSNSSDIMDTPSLLRALSFPFLNVTINPALGAVPLDNWWQQLVVTFQMYTEPTYPAPAPPNYGIDKRIIGAWNLEMSYSNTVGNVGFSNYQWRGPREGCLTKTMRKSTSASNLQFHTQLLMRDESRALRPGTYPSVEIYAGTWDTLVWGSVLG